MGLTERVQLAVRRPDLLARRLRGRGVVEIELDEIAPYVGDDPVILEAGALDGTDTVRLAERWPQGTVHAFEPVPAAFGRVLERTKRLGNVRCYSDALSNATGTARLHVSTKPSGEYRPDASSLLPPSNEMAALPEVAFGEHIEVRTTTLDAWAADVGISRVDVMWLDLQGMELAVLKASPRVLATTTVVCMEVSRKPLYVGNPLREEVVSWMREQGFRVAIDRISLYQGNVLFVRS